MNKDLLKVALRQTAVYLPDEENNGAENETIKTSTSFTLKELNKCGYTCSERLLRRLNLLQAEQQAELLEVVNEVYGVGLNWAPLVKNWLEPTGENITDHVLTYFVNAFGNPQKLHIKGTTLPCGHFIPEGTFPIERYNGCPFCGRPFQLSQTNYSGQGSKLRVLELWTDSDLSSHYQSLLESPVPLDATQKDSLMLLAAALPYNQQTNIAMKETAIIMVDCLLKKGEDEKARLLLPTPTDILRYLWYKHTGHVQIIEPRTLINMAKRNNRHVTCALDNSKEAGKTEKEKLKLHYSRPESHRIADWLNRMPTGTLKACEMMHPKREMWVRMIRALRLTEYAKKDGFEKLRLLLDHFYRKDYTVAQGLIDGHRRAHHADETLALLQQRPGLFARCLFSNMLWFGPEKTLEAFRHALPDVPSRLLLTLGMYSSIYFLSEERVVTPITGIKKQIPAHPLLAAYTDSQRNAMIHDVEQLVLEKMKLNYAASPAPGKKMYIDPVLDSLPLAIGERSTTIQDTSAALTGTHFAVEGSQVRLFMQWGKGLPAQPLDMDLSARIMYADHVADCAFYNLTTTGAKHGGDIREIPNQVGTAEYIELDLNELDHTGAKVVTFFCNAYSCGSLSPNLVVGWMNSKYKMEVSETTGVAYDPSCVQHQVRIAQTDLAKGLMFGVLDIAKREIIWMEIPFTSQWCQGENLENVKLLLNKLEAKTKIGEMLRLKAEAQGMELVCTPQQADEIYDYRWALDTAAVSQLVLG